MYMESQNTMKISDSIPGRGWNRGTWEDMQKMKDLEIWLIKINQGN